MTRHAVWLLVPALLAVAGCKQSQTSTTTQTDVKASAGTASETPAPAPAPAAGAPTSDAKEVTMADGLKYQDLKVGDGAIAETGKTVTVHYTGWLTDGTKFDSSLDRGQPFSFPLGGGRVIKGWDEGVAGMRVGGKRKLTIPPDLGYGDRGAGGVIPPGATLVFDVELLQVN